MKERIKRLVALALAVCMFATLAVPVTAQESDVPSATVAISGNSNGEQITVAVEVAQSTNVSGISLLLKYDPEKVSLNSFSNGELIPDSKYVDRDTDDDGNKDGVVSVAWLVDENSSAVLNDQTGILGTFTFDILPDALGETTFNLTNVRISNADGSKGYSATVTNGSYSQITHFSVTVDNEIENGSIAVDTAVASEGDTITLTASPAENYVLNSLSVTYQVTDEQGTVTTEKLSVQPVEGEENKFTFVMPANDVYVSASFEKKQFAITVKEGISNGEVEVDKEKAAVEDVVRITVKPAEGYSVSTVTFNETPADKVDDTTYEFNMPAENVEVSAEFVANAYNIKVSDGIENGEVTVDRETASVKQVVTITVKPAAGYEIGEVIVTSGEKKLTVTTGTTDEKGYTSYTFEMPANDVKVTATFEAISYEVKVAPNITNGEVTVDKKTATVEDVVTITVKPAEGYSVSKVTFNETPAEKVNDTTYEFKMPAANVEVSAEFVANAYKVTPDESIQNGRVLVSKESAVYGESVTVTVIPDEGYVIDKVTVSAGDTNLTTITGTDGEGNKTYTFTMPDMDVTVSASFLKESTITIETPGGDPLELDYNGDGEIDVGDVVAFRRLVGKGGGTDYNGDGDIDVGDVVALRRKIGRGDFGSSASHGKLLASVDGKELNSGDKVIEGTIVNLTVELEDGYQAETPTVTCSVDGKTVEVEVKAGSEANTYFFEMPAADVRVSVTITAKS